MLVCGGIHQAEVSNVVEGVERPNCHYILMLFGYLTDLHGFRLVALMWETTESIPFKYLQGKSESAPRLNDVLWDW